MKKPKKKNATLKAFKVYDGMDSWKIIFAKSGAAARREGANEIGCDFEDIESCTRMPELDKFAPGPVPASALLDTGSWWFECNECGARITRDGALNPDDEEEVIDCDGIAPQPQAIEFKGAVFCGPQCAWDWIQGQRLRAINRAALEEWACEQIKERFPDAFITYVKAEAEAKYSGEWFSVDATFGLPETQHLGPAPIRFVWRDKQNRNSYPPAGFSISGKHTNDFNRIMRQRKAEKFVKQIIVDLSRDDSAAKADMNAAFIESALQNGGIIMLHTQADGEGVLHTRIVPAEEWRETNG